MAGISRREFLRQGLVGGLATLVSSSLLLPLQAEECSKPAEPHVDIRKQETGKKPLVSVPEFKVYDKGLYTPGGDKPYREIEGVMYDENRRVRGDLEKALGGKLDFKIIPEELRRVTGRDYFDKCAESEIFDSWNKGNGGFVGRYNVWFDKNGGHVADQSLVVVSKKGIFPLLPAGSPTGAIVYVAVARDDGTILVAELGNQPERKLGNAIAIYAPDKDGGYSLKPNACIRLPKEYTLVGAGVAYDNLGEGYEGLRLKHENGEDAILGIYQDPGKKMAFPVYRFSNQDKGEYKNDK